EEKNAEREEPEPGRRENKRTRARLDREKREGERRSDAARIAGPADEEARASAAPTRRGSRAGPTRKSATASAPAKATPFQGRSVPGFAAGRAATTVWPEASFSSTVFPLAAGSHARAAPLNCRAFPK